LQSPPVRFVTLLSQIGFQFSKIHGLSGKVASQFIPALQPTVLAWQHTSTPCTCIAKQRVKA